MLTHANTYGYTPKHTYKQKFILFKAFYVIPERDVPVREYAIDRHVKSRDRPIPKWNIIYMSIIMYNYLIPCEYVHLHT